MPVRICNSSGRSSGDHADIAAEFVHDCGGDPDDADHDQHNSANAALRDGRTSRDEHDHYNARRRLLAGRAQMVSAWRSPANRLSLTAAQN
jgi:hypothetical protein